MERDEELSLVRDALEGVPSVWSRLADRLGGTLASSADPAKWPSAEATALANYFLTCWLPDHREPALTAVISGDESLDQCLRLHFAQFTNNLWHGSAMAADILERHDSSAHKMLVEAYGRALAARLTMPDFGYPGRIAEGIAYDFLADKLVDPKDVGAMLGVVAEGYKPLRPRLIFSLGTWLADRHRDKPKEKQWPVDPDGNPMESADSEALSPLSRRSVTFDDLRQRTNQQLEALAAIPLGDAPYREAALLHERINLLESVKMAYVQLSPAAWLKIAIGLMPWSHELRLRRIGEVVLNLQHAWDLLSAEALRNRLRARDFATTLGVTEDLWSHWLTRGRACVRGHLGEDQAQRLFHWRRHRRKLA